MGCLYHIAGPGRGDGAGGDDIAGTVRVVLLRRQVRGILCWTINPDQRSIRENKFHEKLSRKDRDQRVSFISKDLLDLHSYKYKKEMAAVPSMRTAPKQRLRMDGIYISFFLSPDSVSGRAAGRLRRRPRRRRTVPRTQQCWPGLRTARHIQSLDQHSEPVTFSRLINTRNTEPQNMADGGVQKGVCSQ